MIEILKEDYGDVNLVYAYEIIKTGQGEVINLIINYYSDVNKWGVNKLLTTSVIQRRQLSDVLNYLGVSKEDFEKGFVSEQFKESLVIEDAFDSTEGDVYNISFPSRYITKNGKTKVSFASYDDSKNELNVFINKEDYSDLFKDFDFFEEKAVEKASEILSQGSLIKFKCPGYLKEDIEDVLNREIESGLLK